MSESASRLRMQLNKDAGLKELDKVVLKYGYVNGKPFTFKDHEFQIEIIRDTRSRISVRKCSQVGLSELMVQKTLALAATMKHTRAIFTQPTRDNAAKFSKDRMDSAIEESPFYSSMVKAANNSASQKKIGSFVLYITGSFGANSAISVPAEILINDEVDFSNDAVLGKLSSRLRHAELVDERGHRGMRLKFSTPTVNGYGIDQDFELGHQAYYMAKCTHCNKWVLPDFFKDFYIPGCDEEIANLRRTDIENPRYLFEKSDILCPKCRCSLQPALNDPSRREWVAKKPDVWEHSYQVYPWDAPKYNPPAAIIRQLGEYPLISDFYNFVIGIPYSDAENSFNVEQAYRDRISDLVIWEYPANVARSVRTVMGMDVGKMCHLSVGLAIGKELHVVYAETLRNTRESPATEQVQKRIDHFKCKKMCIDAGPDITLVNTLVNSRDQVTAVVYVRNISGLLPYDLKGEGEVVNADRTKTLKELLARHNNGEIRYPSKPSVKEEIFKHLATTKKIRDTSADGQLVERFVKTSPEDHWVHSLNYLNLAVMLSNDVRGGAVVGVLPAVGRVTVGSNSTAANSGVKGRK